MHIFRIASMKLQHQPQIKGDTHTSLPSPCKSFGKDNLLSKLAGGCILQSSIRTLPILNSLYHQCRLFESIGPTSYAQASDPEMVSRGSVHYPVICISVSFTCVIRLLKLHTLYLPDVMCVLNGWCLTMA